MNSFLILIAMGVAMPVILGQDARQIVEEVQKRAQAKSQRYEGTLEVIDSKSRVSKKRWEYLRLGSFGNSKSVLRFIAPAEVKGVALLIHNHPDRSSDQWMWRPSIERDQRIALQDRSTRFFGTDFSYEDLEERDIDQFDTKLVGDDTIDGVACWKIEFRPREKKVSQYTHSLIWVRKDRYLYARVESFSKSGLARRIQYGAPENVQGIWTSRSIEVEDVSKKSRTVLRFDKLEYNVPLKDEEFTLQALRRAS